MKDHFKYGLYQSLYMSLVSDTFIWVLPMILQTVCMKVCSCTGTSSTPAQILNLMMLQLCLCKTLKMQSSPKSGTKSLRLILPSLCAVSFNLKFPAGTDVSDGFMMDNLRLLPLGSKTVSSVFFTFSVRWLLSHHFTTLPLILMGCYSCTLRQR